MRKPNYRFERAERDRTKQARNEEKARRIQDEKSETFDFSTYLDDEIARSERILKAARRTATITAPNELDGSEIIGLIERHLDELKQLRAQQERRHAPPA